MINWRIPAGLIAVGAVVSLLFGIIAGNPFGVILLRLFLSVVVCAGLGAGVAAVLGKVFPEMGSAPGPSSDGEVVDIVIDEDLSASVLGAEGEAREAEESAAVEEDAGDEELVEEPEILAPDASDSPFPVEGETVDSDGAVDGAPPVPEMPAAAPGDLGELDTLPDIDRLNTDAAPESSAAPAGSAGKPRRSKAEDLVQEQDPARLARAVRTFMNKDT